MKSPLFTRVPSWCVLGRAVAVAALSILSGCDVLSPCDDADLASLKAQKEALQTSVTQLQLSNATRPPPMHAQPAAMAAAAFPKVTYLRLTSGPPNPFPRFVPMRNFSSGKFVAQVTVAFHELAGLTLGTSSGGLRYFQSKPNGDDARTRYLGAAVNSTGDGFLVSVSDLAGTTFVSNIAVNGIVQIDLQIEQTDTSLIFRARPTTEPQVSGGWTDLYTENTPLSAELVQLAVGLHAALKGGRFYFTHFAADGDGLGGETEHEIVVPLRASADALRGAKAKILAEPSDLAGALAAIDTAIAKRVEARVLLKRALVDDTLQSPDGGVLARRSVDSLEKPVATTRAAVATLDPKKARPQAANLESFAVKEEGIMANVLGWKMPPTLSHDLFSLHVP